MTRSTRIEVLTSHQCFAELESELWALFEQTHFATPFQSPAWWLPWAESFVADGELRVVTLHIEGRLAGVIPLIVRAESSGWTCTLLGRGITDYLDALCPAVAPELLTGIVEETMGHLAMPANQVDLTDLPAQSGLLQLRAVGRITPEVDCVCPVVDLPPTYPALVRGLPGWLVRNLKQTESRLSRLGQLTWETADEANLEAYLEVFFQLHGARWRSRGSGGVLSSPAVQRFHRQAARRLLGRGMLRLETALLDGVPIAAAYLFLRQDAHLYLTGFDPSIDRVSLGSLVIGKALAAAIAGGYRHFDFLRGAEPYKYAWGARNAFTYRITLRPGTVGPESAHVSS